MPWPNTGWPRKDLAEGIRTEVRKARWQVYDHPADVVKLPCWIIEPVETVPDTFDVRLRFSFRVSVVVPRPNLSTAYDTADQAMADFILPLLNGGTQFKFMSLGEYDQVTYNDIDALRYSVNVDAIMA